MAIEKMLVCAIRHPVVVLCWLRVGKKWGSEVPELYGQEVNWNLYALTKMNLMLNGFKGATFFGEIVLVILNCWIMEG